jgi:iron complex outermembrane recepter protein
MGYPQAVGSERKMYKDSKKILGSRLLTTRLLPVFASVSLFGTAAMAQPAKKVSAAIPASALARASESNSRILTIESAKALLDRGTAADLSTRPSLWDWTQPVTMPQVSQITPADTAQTNIAAAPAPEDTSDFLDEVSVTANRRPTRGREITSTTYSVNKQDFKAQGATTVTDALSLVPGVTIGTPALGGVRNAGSIFVRGFNDQRFQLLRDGLPLQRSSNNRNDISRSAILDLERIEVLTGGATLRYGSNSVGGVVNLITETPQGPPKLTLEYQNGSYGFSRYGAKYGGGDDTFSYNIAYEGIVAFNNYPFSFTLPNQALYYGSLDPEVAANPGLQGFLRPEVGPPIEVKGVVNSANNASDQYSAKLVFKPDPNNKIFFRVGQINSQNLADSPGFAYFPACTGTSTPVDANGTPVPCDPQRFVVATATTTRFGTGFDGSADGRIYSPGRAYPLIEPVQTETFRYQRTNQASTEASLRWDYQITPTTSVSSYLSYFGFQGNQFRPNPYFIGTDVLGQNPAGIVATNPGQSSQPYFLGQKLVAETALDTQISPGQKLSFGVNITNDRSYQIQTATGAPAFFDRTITRTSAFLIDDISFGPELIANLGVRYTYSTQFGVVTVPGIGVRYTPSNFISLRANASYVYNAPSLSDLYANSPPFIANPTLVPETGATYDFGFDLTPARNLDLRFTYFNTYLQNPITGVQIFAGGAPVGQQSQNLAGQRSSGIEVLTNWQLNDQLQARLAWTNIDSRAIGRIDNINDTTQTFTFPNFYEYQDAFIPANFVTLGFTYTNKKLTATLLGRYSSGTRRPNSTFYSSAYATLDLNVEVPITDNLTLTGNIFNLTDTQYEYGGGFSSGGFPAPGTTFRVGGRLEIGG